MSTCLIPTRSNNTQLPDPARPAIELQPDPTRSDNTRLPNPTRPDNELLPDLPVLHRHRFNLALLLHVCLYQMSFVKSLVECPRLVVFTNEM